MPTIAQRGCTIHYTVSGSGSAVLLLAGWGATVESWGPLASRLSADHLVVAVDNRGAGRTQHTRRTFTINSMADDAIAVLDDAGIDSAIVIGNSLGGLIAQSMALRYPGRVRSLVLLSTSIGTPSVPSHPLLLRDVMRAVSRRIARRGRPADTPGEITYSGAQLLATLGWFGLGALPRIHVSTLLIHGRRDLVIPLINARIAARLLPHARLVTLDAGHLIIDDALDEVMAALNAFFEEPSTAGGGVPSAA